MTDEDDRFIQLAATADLRRKLTARLTVRSTALESRRRDGEGERVSGQCGSREESSEEPVSPSHRPRVDLARIVRRVRWLRAYSMFEITWQYYRLARLLMPHRYLKQVGFGPCWFVHVDPTAAAPRFQAGKLVRGGPGVDIGPMATQADAGRLIEILEDAFDLCRYHHILLQAPHGRPCAYLDMGKCPAPCDGRVSMVQYREMIADALAFACGRRDGRFQHWDRAMREAAAGREYERAGAIKQSIERARRIEHDAFRHLQPVRDLRYLVVQRGAGTTQVKPFFIRSGEIGAGESTRLKELTTVARSWLDGLHRPIEADSSAQGNDPIVRSEQLWLLSHFLYKRDPPGLYLRADILGSPETLAEQIQSHFASKRAEELRDLGEAAGAAAADAGIDGHVPTLDEVNEARTMPPASDGGADGVSGAR